jgi:hypothetical protein
LKNCVTVRVASKIHNLFRPYISIVETRNKAGKLDKKTEKLVTYSKVMKLLQK